MKAVFQNQPSDSCMLARAGVEASFSLIFQAASDNDLARIYDALDDLATADPVFFRSLVSQRLTRSIFNLVSAEEEYRERQRNQLRMA